jgi:hypothetical protein
MAVRNLAQFEEKPYDPRWFIWTVVFLIVSGVSLVSYILITTSNDDAGNVYVPLIHATRSSHPVTDTKP